MNKILALFVPLLFLGTFLFALLRKVRVYESFTQGVKGAIPLIVSIFPYIAAVTILCKLLETSGIGAFLSQRLQPLFSFFGIPQEIAPLVLIKPLSGSGSVAVLTEILEKYGVDSYVSRCACVVYGSSETIFYIGAVYFAGLKRKKLNVALGISLCSYFLSVIFACFVCNFL